MTDNYIFCFGMGYSASVLADALKTQGWRVGGTSRTPEKRQLMRQQNVRAFDLDDKEAIAQELESVTHILISIPPSVNGDEVLARYAADIVKMPNLQWLGYLSTTGVYGDHQGAWVDESTPVSPPSDRLKRRVEAEQMWLNIHQTHNVPTHIFRLAGIYGPGRSAVDQLFAGNAKRIDKPGQFFSRIHVVDIGRALFASICNPTAGEIFNICDDEPAAASEVMEYASKLLGKEVPPLVPFAQADLSEMAREFYSSNRRVSNKKAKEKIGFELAFPTYREGMESISGQLQAA